MPGGTHAVGTLTVCGAPSLAGATLLMDAAADGTCDRLVCVGDLSLQGLALQVDLSGHLNTRKCYTPVACAGALTGTLSGLDLPDGWHVRYDRTPGAGSVTLYWASHATVFSVR